MFESLMPKLDASMFESLMPKFDASMSFSADAGQVRSEWGEVSDAEAFAFALILVLLSTIALARAQVVAAWMLEHLWRTTYALWRLQWELENGSPGGDMAVTAAAFLLGYAWRGHSRTTRSQSEELEAPDDGIG